MAAKDKDTIYIDIDDEITGIIDKLRSSDGKIVALVLPKRAAVFQSIVNMKLLKRAADQEKKHLVLITSEAGLLPLAGAAGVHVAKTLTSKPEIPAAPGIPVDDDEAIDEINGEPVDASKTVGELAHKPSDDGVETLVLDDDDLPPEDTSEAPQPKTFEPPKDKAKKNKKLAVPNFERFRLVLILGVLLLIIGIGGTVFANYSLAKATVSIKTDATTVDVGSDLNISTSAKQYTQSDNTVPGKLASQQKTFTQQVPTTGQKNNGNKASGSVRLVNCNEDNDLTVPAGTGVSSNGNTYITQQTVTVPVSSFKKSVCQKDGTVNVNVIAQSGGSSYNGANTFTVAGFADITGSAASQITGGTDNIVQTVNQNDINNAKNKITASNDSAVKSALKSDLQKFQYFPIEATYTAGTPTTTTSANVGEVATTVTVTETITYTMLGARSDAIKELLADNIKTQIDSEQQSILDDGLTSAVFNVTNQSATAAQLSIATKATVGPDISIESIKDLAAGKKSGEVKDSVKAVPGVVSVDIKLSPFWKSSIPKDHNRITVVIAKPTGTSKGE